jgi:hypothetical protein
MSPSFIIVPHYRPPVIKLELNVNRRGRKVDSPFTVHDAMEPREVGEMLARCFDVEENKDGGCSRPLRLIKHFRVHLSISGTLILPGSYNSTPPLQELTLAFNHREPCLFMRLEKYFSVVAILRVHFKTT